MIKAKYTEGLIVNILCHNYFNFIDQVVIPNCCINYMEADLMIVSLKRFIHEVEVKCSKRDLLQEFAPHMLKNPKTATWAKKCKHDIITNSASENHIISRYSVAFPPELESIAKQVVPHTCGLIKVTAGEQGDELNGSITILRNPKRLSYSRELNEKEYIKVARIVCARYWNQRLYGKNGRK